MQGEGGNRRGSVAWRPLLCRHRACNMFLESYKASWILTEDHSFEDRMIDDLSVSWRLLGDMGQGWVGRREPSIEKRDPLGLIWEKRQNSSPARL